MSPAERPCCPVCAWPSSGQAVCPECCWVLQSGYLVGEATPEDEEAFRRRLRAACRRFDLRAALRAAGPAGDRDEDLLKRLERFVRALPPSLGEIEAIGREVDHEQAAMADGIEKIVDPALARLVDGHLDALAFVDLGPDAIALHTVTVDDLGIPRMVEPAPREDWKALVPALPDDVAQRRFQLAGGAGAQSPDREAMDRALKQSLLRLPLPEGRVHLLLLSRTTGWTVPERAARVLQARVVSAARVRLAPSAGDARETVEQLVRRAPLRHPYDLALAVVAGDGGPVDVTTRALFPAGAAFRPDRPPVAEIELFAPPAPTEPLALPVVVRQGTTPRDWRVVRLGSVVLAPMASTTLRIALEAPGRLRFVEPPGIGDDTRRWDELLDLVPPQVDFADSPLVDLVCAVELVGDQATVGARLALLCETVELFQVRCPVPGSLRVGLLGYGDHGYGVDRQRGPAPEEPVDAVPLSRPDAARRHLERWAPRARGHDFATAVEDALVALGRLRWRDGSRRLLLTVGSRPPHPPAGEDNPTLPCPGRHDWRALLRAARERLGIHCLAVRGLVLPTAWRAPDHWLARRADDAWRALGADGLFTDDNVDADRLLAAAGVGPPAGGPLPLPLLEPIGHRRPRPQGVP